MTNYSQECLQILELLKDRKNVLMMGPPASGKTRLMSEVADAFQNGFIAQSTPKSPQHIPDATIPIPAQAPSGAGMTPIPQLPSPDRTQRRVFEIVFNANSKPRDFLSGLVPEVRPDAASTTFRVAEGKLIQANKFALEPDSAALLIIDELNRGPAVQLFGDALVALEADKRLDENNQPLPTTWTFDVINQHGVTEPMALSTHVYVLAAMNQADVSVEPLDVAFIRRWEPFRVKPNSEIARQLLGAAGEDASLPEIPTTPGEVVEAAIRAWIRVNNHIETGRGEEFQLGHGVFLTRNTAPPPTLEQALDFAIAWWNAIVAHVDEVFFGDVFGMAATLRADPDSAFYRLESVAFGQDQRQVLRRPVIIDRSNIYSLLRWIAG